MRFPMYGYAIFPYDDNGEIAGVYVGCTHNLVMRMNSHRNAPPKNDTQRELHALMKRNGYEVIQLFEVEVKERFLEYLWIDIFDRYSKYRVFNKAKGLYGNGSVSRTYSKYYGTPPTPNPGKARWEREKSQKP